MRFGVSFSFFRHLYGKVTKDMACITILVLRLLKCSKSNKALNIILFLFLELKVFSVFDSDSKKRF